MANTITVKVNPRDFARGVKYAKTFGGRFDGNSKTWELPANEQVLNSLKAAGSYGLIVVSNNSVQHDPACPAYYGGAGCECR